MATKKTYGVSGLIEFQPVISAGKAKFRIHFTGGAITSYGVTPAEFTTSDPMMQAVIEKSSYFKSGRIVILRTYEIASSKKTTPKTAKRPEPKNEYTVPVNTKVEPLTEPTGNPEGSTGNIKEPTINPEGSTENPEEPVSAENEDGPKLEEVKVVCLEDAAEWLKENFGIAKRKLTSKSAVEKAANEHGYTFVYGEAK